MNTRITILLIMLLTAGRMQAQLLKDGRIHLNGDGSHYFKFTMVNQVWVRHADLNPGSLINGYPKSTYNDIGIRRFRIQAFGQVADRVFIYSQIGMNNFNFLSDRKAGFFVHDVLGEYELVRKKLSLGGGLNAWSGLARFASPSVGTILGVDAPLWQQTTNDVTDQFLRKLSIYAKGKLDKLDYRVALASPLAIQRSANYDPTLRPDANFSPKPASLQTNAYLQWQFLDQESNTTPYMTGTYLGAKRVFNVGAGIVYQPDAMWRHGVSITDTIETSMVQLGADVYFDAPVNKEKGTAISAYGSLAHLNFGDRYLRNAGPLNPANGSSSPLLINGGGVGFPMYGTGTVLYGQLGYKFRNNLIGSTTLLPYVSLQHADYERLNEPVNFWDAGVNWLLKGHTSKLTLAYQDRPLYSINSGSTLGRKDGRRGAVILQYQVFLN